MNNIPKGYKLVPVEPTCEMLHAAVKVSGVLVIYEAMLASAPTPPQPIYDEAKERELFEAWADEKGFCLDCEFFKKGNNYIDQATGWLYESWTARAKAGEVGHD